MSYSGKSITFATDLLPHENDLYSLGLADGYAWKNIKVNKVNNQSVDTFLKQGYCSSDGTYPLLFSATSDKTSTTDRTTGAQLLNDFYITRDSQNSSNMLTVPDLQISNSNLNTNGIVYIDSNNKLVSTSQGASGVLEGKGSSPPTWCATQNGALYAESSGGQLNWGTLPIGQGGTGASSFTSGQAVVINSQGNAFEGRGITNITGNTTFTANTNLITGNTLQNVANSIATSVSSSAVQSGLANFTGTNKITTVGTISTGTWNGTAIDIAHGGTGVSQSNPVSPHYALLGPSTGNANAPSWRALVASDMPTGIPVSNLAANTINIGTQQVTLGTAVNLNTLIAELGMGTAFNYKGVINTAPVNNDPDYANGDVVVVSGTLSDDGVYAYNGSSWNRLSDSGGYKILQQPVNSNTVTASSSATTFISDITQDNNGVISVNKNTIPQYVNVTSDTQFYVSGSNSSTANTNTQLFRTDVYVTTGGVLMGAAWNDYAEYRECHDNIKPGECIVENGDGTLSRSSKRMQAGAEIVSDTFGFAIGKTNTCQTPIAVSGRVLAYGDKPNYKFKIGAPVCAGENGTISEMTEEEARAYPWLILGTVSSIPQEETWGTGKIKVNNRIWIRVR